MADGKAQITDLNLTQIDANLSDYLSDIRPYEGFVQCNSPWIGGLLNNVYKKKVAELPEGHKLVKVHNGDIYSLAIEEDGKNGFYKNGNLIQTITPETIKKEKFESSVYEITDKNTFVIKAKENLLSDVEFFIPFDYTIDYYKTGSIMYFLFFDKNINFEVFDNYSINGIQYLYVNYATGEISHNLYSAYNKKVCFNGIEYNTTFSNLKTLIKQTIAAKYSESASFDTEHHIFVNCNIDSNGIICQTKSSFTTESGNIRTCYNFAVVYPLNETELTIIALKDVGIDSSINKWRKGSKKYTCSGFDFLYYDDILTDISINDSVIINNIAKIIKTDAGYDNTNQTFINEPYVLYTDEKNVNWKITKEIKEFVDFNFIDDFILFKTTDYLNTYDINLNEFICRSDDYNDRGVLSSPQVDSSSSENLISGMFVSGWHVNAQAKNIKVFSTLYPQTICSYSDVPIIYKRVLLNVEDQMNEKYRLKHEIDLYYAETAGGSAKYFMTQKDINTFYVKSDLVDTFYPINADNNILYNVSMMSDIEETYINEKKVKIENGSYILAKSQDQENIFGYYEFTFTEVDDIFLTQGQFYGINDKYIYSLGLDNSVVSINGVVANKQDLMFLGAFPTMALFWSKLDKSLYSFTGDAILQKVKEAYRINNIYNVYCDPSRLTMIISTDIGVIIIYQNQTMLLEEMKEPIEHIYYDSNTYVLDDTLLSLSEQEDYEPQNIKLHTEYYGVGSGVKSVNDCVYIRIAKGKKNGFIKFQSFVLNDRSTASEEKTVDLPDSVFDPITNSAYIKYQPKNQAGLGFSVKIETTNPVVSMAIGHKPESIANTALKL